VRTIAWAVRELPPDEIASGYDLTAQQVTDALAFYDAHRGEIEASLEEDRQLERAHGSGGREHSLAECLAALSPS